MEKDIFAKKLIALRKRKGYTQQDLADRLQVTNKAVSRWETGEGFPDISLLVPLCDALDVKCDDLLRDEKNYTDIKKADIQQYLPFLVSVSSIIVFYALQALNVPVLFMIGLYCFSMVFSFYLMLHHTDKKHLSLLTKFNVMLSYFPLSVFLNKGLMLFVTMKFFGIQGLFIQVANNGMEIGSDVLSKFLVLPLIGYGITILVCILLYALLDRKFKKRYTLCDEKHKVNKTILKNVKRIGDVLTGISIFLVFASLYYQYNNLQTPIDVSNMYIMDHMNETILNIKIGLCLCILPSILYHCIMVILYHKQWCFIRNLSILIIYLGSIIMFTYLDGVYLTSPILFISIGGIVIIGEVLYEVIRYRKSITFITFKNERI